MIHQRWGCCVCVCVLSSWCILPLTQTTCIFMILLLSLIKHVLDIVAPLADEEPSVYSEDKLQPPQCCEACKQCEQCVFPSVFLVFLLLFLLKSVKAAPACSESSMLRWAAADHGEGEGNRETGRLSGSFWPLCFFFGLNEHQMWWNKGRSGCSVSAVRLLLCVINRHEEALNHLRRRRPLWGTHFD